jgi:hypothetical protein
MTALATPATNYRTTFMDDNAIGRLSSFHWPPIKEKKRSWGSTGKSSPSKQTPAQRNDSVLLVSQFIFYRILHSISVSVFSVIFFIDWKFIANSDIEI